MYARASTCRGRSPGRTRLLRREGVHDCHPAERAPRRGAQLRQADHRVRRGSIGAQSYRTWRARSSSGDAGSSRHPAGTTGCHTTTPTTTTTKRRRSRAPPHPSRTEAHHMTSDKPRRLGRTRALLATRPNARRSTARRPRRAPTPTWLPHAAQRADRADPPTPTARKEFRPRLADLEASLKARDSSSHHRAAGAERRGRVQLIAGERRLRAATRAGWTEIPAVVKSSTTRRCSRWHSSEPARSDLNPSRRRRVPALINEFSLTSSRWRT